MILKLLITFLLIGLLIESADALTFQHFLRTPELSDWPLRVFTHTLNELDGDSTNEISTSLFTNGMTAIQLDVYIDARLVRSGICKESEHLLFYIPSTSGQILDIYAQLNSTNAGEAAILIRTATSTSELNFIDELEFLFYIFNLNIISYNKTPSKWFICKIS